ncbi:hypothetical protein [Ferroplasma sp.]|uniref:hypothetical protein n=1 Tax=Ferroplasma sp. TaxID=2591003 RepID=UPI002617F397|nr:hypothetical protein [Ferroplasma sp.]
MEVNIFKSIAKEIACGLKGINKRWDGKNVILEMKNNNYSQWKQMEWIGFYFQFLCEKNLQEIMTMPGNIYGNVKFDAFKNIPWDFKCHVQNDVKGKEKTDMIINDMQAVNMATEQYGYIGLVIGLGNAEYNDRDRTFKNWVDELKGGKSKYENERIERDAGSRLRKVAFDLNDVIFVKINKEDLGSLGIYNQGRNSNGHKRKPKYELDLKDLNKFEHYFSSELC